MAEENIKEVIEEIKNADEETLHSTIKKWFESTRTDGMKLGAKFISAAVFGCIQKHLKKKSKPSLRDHQRCMDEIIKIIAVQLVEQDETTKENEDDGTTE
jgi:formate dehydrogenase maturation protein FdhE